MALKYELDSIDDLDEATQALYEKGEDGKFRLSVEGIPEPQGNGNDDLAERLRKLEANNADLLKEKREAAEQARKAKEDAAKKSGDTEALEKSWREKLEAREAELTAELEKREQAVSSLTVGATANQVAAELFGEHAKLMLPHINARLSYELKDGKPEVRVLEDGKPSAKSLDDLKAEIKNSDDFAPFVVGSRAKGPGGHASPGGPSGKKFADMSGEELKELREKSPENYQRLRDEHYAGG